MMRQWLINVLAERQTSRLVEMGGVSDSKPAHVAERAGGFIVECQVSIPPHLHAALWAIPPTPPIITSAPISVPVAHTLQSLIITSHYPHKHELPRTI